MILKEMLQEQLEAGYAEGRTDGIAEGKAEAILDLLADLPGEVSEELREFLFSEKDFDALRRYLKLAASVSSVEDFVQQFPKWRQSARADII